MSSGGTNPPNDKGKDVASTTTRPTVERTRKWRTHLAPQHVLDQLVPMPLTKDTQTGKDVASTTTRPTREEIRVDKSIPMPTTAHTQTPSPRTYAPPPPTHTSSAVYPQHAYAPPKLTPSGYTLPPIYPPPTYSHHAYAPSVNPPPTNPLSGGPLHKRPPSGKGKGVGSITTSHSSKVTPGVSSSPDQFIPVPTTAHTQIPSPRTYVPPPPTSSQSPSTQFPLHVYPLNAYAPSTYALPKYPLSSEPSKKRPPSDKGEDIASTTNGRSRKVTRVVSGSPLDQFIPMPMTAHTQTPSPHTYTQPPPTRSQSPSTKFPLLVYPPHTYAPPAYTPSTSAPPTYPTPTYPLSSGPSHKVPQFSSMPNPGFQGTQGTPLKSSHPKPSQRPPYQAGQDGIHDAEGINMFDDGRHVIQPSTKG
jgi:hypothetical protein